MTRVNANTWTTTVEAAAGHHAVLLEGKYDLGVAAGGNVEKNADCADISNRSMSVNGGTVNDTVANWGGRDPPCGSATAVINVTNCPRIPRAGTPCTCPGTTSVLGTGIPSADDWIATDYPMIKTGTGTWTLTITGVPTTPRSEYKFTLGSWNNVEESSSCAFVANRAFGFDTADTSYPATDTVAAWERRRQLLTSPTDVPPVTYPDG